MSDHANNDLPALLVCQIENPVITNSDAPAVAVPEFLTSVGERMLLQSQERLCNPRLSGAGKATELLLFVPRDLDALTHARILRSLSASRIG